MANVKTLRISKAAYMADIHIAIYRFLRVLQTRNFPTEIYHICISTFDTFLRKYASPYSICYFSNAKNFGYKFCKWCQMIKSNIGILINLYRTSISPSVWTFYLVLGHQLFVNFDMVLKIHLNFSVTKFDLKKKKKEKWSKIQFFEFIEKFKL